MSEEKEESGITLGDIFRTIFSQKWLALIIVAAITIVGTLGMYFMGKRSEVYSVSFVLQLPNTGDTTTSSYTYPDGESFYYTDLISATNLKKVASRDGFNGIDVDKMVKNGDITIVRAVDRVDASSKDGVYDLNYTIKVKSKYFDDEDIAREFIEVLVSFPRDHISSMNINYDQSLTTSKASTTYSEQLNLLKNQLVYIQGKYASLISAHGGELEVNGKMLASYKDEIDDYLRQDRFTSLKGLADKNGYIKSEDAKVKYVGDKEAKELALEEAEKQLEALKEVPAGSTIIDGEIIALAKQIGTLKYEIETLDRYIAAFDDTSKIRPSDFEQEIAKVEEAVERFTEGIKPVASFVYGRVTKINYSNSEVVKVEGGRGVIMSAGISLVAGIVVAAIVAYAVGWNKTKKKKTSVIEMPVSAQAEAQAAVTSENEEDKK